MHLVNFNLWKATAGHIFVLLLIAIEEVSGIDANADGPLGQRSEQSVQGGYPGRRQCTAFSSGPWVPAGPPHEPRSMDVTAQGKQQWHSPTSSRKACRLQVKGIR